MPEIINMSKRMGRSPVGGYAPFDQGTSVELQAINVKTGALMLTHNVRLPKDPDDLLHIIAALLRHATGGPISAQAALVAMLGHK